MSTPPGNKTPIEVRRAGLAAHRNTEALQVLLEQWLSCEGRWNESEFVKTVRAERHQRTKGRREWLTQKQLSVKLGSEDAAAKICEAKMHDPEASKSQVRTHRDMHGKDSAEPWISSVLPLVLFVRSCLLCGPCLHCIPQETRQYLCWVEDAEEDESDLVTSDLFRAAENSALDGALGGQASTRKKDKKSKKSKGKKSKRKRSTSTSSSDSTASSSSSSSEAKLVN